MSSGVDLRGPTVAGGNARAAGAETEGETSAVVAPATRSFDASPSIARLTAKTKALSVSSPNVAGPKGDFATDKVIRVLGAGSQGRIELVEKRGHTHAKKSSLATGSLEKEIRILAKIGKDAIHVLIPDFVENGALYFPVMRSDLSTALKTKYVVLDKSCFDNIALQIAQGLKYLGENKIVHLDLKPDNILVEEGPDLHLAISDFGLSKETGEMTENSQGTLQFMAPEHVREEKLVHPSADIYAFAVTLFVVLTNQYPFRLQEPIPVFFHKGELMENSRYDLLSPMPILLDRLKSAAFEVNEVSDPRLILITDCITKAPEERPTAQDLVRRIQEIKE